MKMLEEHYEELREMITKVLDSNGVTVKEWIDDCAKLGLSEKRARWDMIWAVEYPERVKWFDKVYPYADDTHIDTALRNLVKEM